MLLTNICFFFCRGGVIVCYIKEKNEGMKNSWFKDAQIFSFISQSHLTNKYSRFRPPPTVFFFPITPDWGLDRSSHCWPLEPFFVTSNFTALFSFLLVVKSIVNGGGYTQNVSTRHWLIVSNKKTQECFQWRRKTTMSHPTTMTIWRRLIIGNYTFAL